MKTGEGFRPWAGALPLLFTAGAFVSAGQARHLDRCPGGIISEESILTAD